MHPADARIESCSSHGLDAVRLRGPLGDEVTVALFGGQVHSWRARDGRERLYRSPTAVFDCRQPVRGGVPVCFPQFGSRGSLPQHGFARTSRWQVAASSSDDAVSLRLVDNAHTRMMWPHAFELRLTVRLAGDRLDLTLDVSGDGDADMECTAALHTYLRTTDGRQARITGLQGLAYHEAPRWELTRTDAEAWRSAAAAMDRIYDQARSVRLADTSGALEIRQTGFPHTVVWNPGELSAGGIADLPARAWLDFVCIEAAVTEPIVVPRGQRWRGTQSLVVAPSDKDPPN